jgi:16S rRNA (adenine1518-N6/adenine1519-N6)-dimethyltransferase
MNLPAHQPRKRFGQNFLRDAQVIARIVDAIAPKSDDRLVEIGPGQGAMTLPLLQRAGALTAIELDRDLIPTLRASCAPHGALEIIQSDVLQVDFQTLSQQLGGTLRVAGNLPYNISTPLLFHLMSQLNCVQDMHFMLQKEVVMRMAASPGGKDYGRLSVMLQAQCQVVPLFDVAPASFFPAPKVWSAIVRLLPHSAQPSKEALSALDRVVRAAFSARRKTLSNALKGTLTSEQITAAEVDPGARAETLSQAAYWRLVQQLPA